MSQDVESVVMVVSAGPVGGRAQARLDTSDQIWGSDCDPFCHEYAYAIVLVVSLLFALGCIWRWSRNRSCDTIRKRCRISMFAAALNVLFCSTISLVLDYISILDILGGVGEATSGFRMLGTSRALVYFCTGFAVFSFIFLLALILGLYETTTASPAVKNEDGLDNRKPGSAP